MTTRDVLSAAWGLIEDPAHWTQGWAYRDADGEALDHQAGAVSFCAVGAIAEDYTQGDGENLPLYWAVRNALDDAAGALGFLCAMDLNDEATHAEVERMFALAVAMA